MQILINSFLISYHCKLILTVFGKQRENAASKSIFVLSCNKRNVRLFACETGSKGETWFLFNSLAANEVPFTAHHITSCVG